MLDIFNADAFKFAAMTEAINKVPTNPGTLGQLNLFNTRPVRTDVVGIEEQNGQLKLIRVSERGSPMDQNQTTKRKMRYFETVRIAKQDRIMASELQFVRKFNTEDQVKSVQEEIAQRMNGSDGLLADVEYTKEYFRLGAIQGKFLDTDGTPIYDYFSEFGITPNPTISFALATAANGDLRENIQKSVIRPMRKKAQGARYTGVTALCSAGFFDALLKNPEVRASYEGIPEQTWLRTTYDGQSFDFGGVEWIEYIGDDADADITIAPDTCIFVPKAVGGSVFEVIYAPAESFDDIGTMGREVYASVTPDREHNRYVDLEVASYPLFICKRPDLLFNGTVL